MGYNLAHISLAFEVCGSVFSPPCNYFLLQVAVPYGLQFSLGPTGSKFRSADENVCDRSEESCSLLVTQSRRPSEVPPTPFFEKDDEKKRRRADSDGARWFLFFSDRGLCL